MDVMAVLGLAGSVSLLAGWRLYLSIFATGLAMRLGALPLPEHLHGLDVLASPWVMGVAGVAAVTEFFADKVMWLDSIWDAVHTVIRPIGGALLALAIVDPSDPATQVIAFVLGGGRQPRRPCRQSRRARGRQHQPRTGQQHRAVHRGRCRNRGPALHGL